MTKLKKYITGTVFVVLIVLLLFSTVSTAGLIDYRCEKIAKDYQKTHGGYLIFIQPLKDGGMYDLGPYNGHFINKAYSRDRGVYYIDVGTQTYFSSTEEVLDWYLWNHINEHKNAELFNVNEQRTPFPIIWHY